ncbi:MAG: YHS domain-containing protein [Euryarchaeota archaeon]|nr:YHS domain-containing protein [Euryarchaeota archaeon]
MVRDPVCRMEVDPAKTAYSEEGSEFGREGLTYYFCSPMCRSMFLENPRKYLEAGGGVPMGEVNLRVRRMWGMALALVLALMLVGVFLVSRSR